MARRVETFVADTGRDTGKTFRITEMPASRAEAWATRLLLALGKSGIEVPEGVFAMGMAGVAAVGIRSLGQLPWEVAQPLMNEMMECIEIQPDVRHPQVHRRLVEEDIEEVATRLKLRDEVIHCHTGFSIAAFVSNLRSLHLAEAEAAAERVVGTGPATETSQSASDA